MGLVRGSRHIYIIKVQTNDINENSKQNTTDTMLVISFPLNAEACFGKNHKFKKASEEKKKPQEKN